MTTVEAYASKARDGAGMSFIPAHAKALGGTHLPFVVAATTDKPNRVSSAGIALTLPRARLHRQSRTNPLRPGSLRKFKGNVPVHSRSQQAPNSLRGRRSACGATLRGKFATYDRLFGREFPEIRRYAQADFAGRMARTNRCSTIG